VSWLIFVWEELKVDFRLGRVEGWLVFCLERVKGWNFLFGEA
jgi:hypothetical protein